MLVVLLVALVLLVACSVAQGRSQQAPGTVVRAWVLRWPKPGQRKVYFKRFAAPPGLLRSVRVLFYDNRVPGPPYASVVACKNSRHAAVAQKSWLWDGRSVYVLLYLQPGQCEVAGTFVRAKVVMTSVGT